MIPDHPLNSEAVAWADAVVDGALVNFYPGKMNDRAEFVTGQATPTIEHLLETARERKVDLREYDFVISVELVHRKKPAWPAPGAEGTDPT